MLHVRVIKAKDPAEMGKLAADQFEAMIQSKPACVIGLATGSTPIPLYKELIAREKAGKIDFSRVRSANLDEYKGLAPDHPQSYRKFMQENLFDHIAIKPENTIVPDGLATDIPAMCAAYEENIERWGGVDLQLLGIGHDGHIGFNEPEDHFPTMTHNIEKESLKQTVINLFGHTHQQTNFYNNIPQIYHVGIDSHNNYPVLLDDIIEEIKTKYNGDKGEISKNDD